MSRARHLRCDRGETLVEVLLTVMIVGLSFAALLGGVSTSIVVSDLHRKQASEQTLIRSYADAVQASPAWKGCAATTADYAPGAVSYTVPPSYGGTYVPSATSVQFWDLVSLSFKPTCTLGIDRGLHQISLQVRSNDLRAVEKVVVVKGCSGPLILAGGICPP